MGTKLHEKGEGGGGGGGEEEEEEEEGKEKWILGLSNFIKVTWVWKLFADIAGGKEAEGVWEQGVKENIRT